ncbi:MAG: hypothetical protein WBE61_00725 [Nitrososphaeraceae archaeon]
MLAFPRDHDTGGIGGILDISRREKDPQQHNNTLEQISHVTPMETNGSLSAGML